MRKYKWSTHKIVKETRDSITLFFDTGNREFNYLPGQFLNISCQIEGEHVMRSYSFSSVPDDPYPSITVKRVINGIMSNFLVDQGHLVKEWDIEGPFGNFVLDQAFSEYPEIVFLAGGSGISPLFSMLKSITRNDVKPLLIYSSKVPDETIFFHELEQMHSDEQISIYYSFTSAEISSLRPNYISGRYSPLILRSIIKKQVQIPGSAHFYICGPEKLMALYQDTLRAMDIPEKHIHMEYFDPIPAADQLPINEEFSKEVIVNYFEDNYMDDELQTYACTLMIEVKAGQFLLDAMREHHIKVSNSCKKGTCGACWAVKDDGTVRMVNNYALTEEQVSEGMILLCQSHPLDDKVCITLS